MKRVVLLAAIAICGMLAGCTQNQRVRNFGGTMEINLQPGEKLLMATWKGEDLFYLTEPMEEGYEPKDKTFHENASFGIMESTVVFRETR